MRKIKDFGGKIWNTKAETIISLKARLKKMFLYIYILSSFLKLFVRILDWLMYIIYQWT